MGALSICLLPLSFQSTAKATGERIDGLPAEAAASFQSGRTGDPALGELPERFLSVDGSYRRAVHARCVVSVFSVSTAHVGVPPRRRRACMIERGIAYLRRGAWWALARRNESDDFCR
jgi:hypothetical protein